MRGQRTRPSTQVSRWIGTGFVTDLGAYESIAGTVTVGTLGQASIEFTNIPTGYKHLQVRGSFTTSTGNSIYMRMNGDSTNNYSTHRMFGAGSAGVFTGVATSTSGGYFFSNNGSGGNCVVVLDVLDYANTNIYKTMRLLFGQDSGSPETGFASASYFTNTNAISGISFHMVTGVFVEHSKFALYGIKG